MLITKSFSRLLNLYERRFADGIDHIKELREGVNDLPNMEFDPRGAVDCLRIIAEVMDVKMSSLHVVEIDSLLDDLAERLEAITRKFHGSFEGNIELKEMAAVIFMAYLISYLSKLALPKITVIDVYLVGDVPDFLKQMFEETSGDAKKTVDDLRARLRNMRPEDFGQS